MFTIERPKFKERDFFNSLILFILKLEVFFIPLFFFPFSFEAFEFGKQNLLWFFTGLGVILWLIKSFIIDKKIIYQRTPLDLPILILLILWGLSVIFSVDRVSSLVGYYGRFSDAYLSTVCFALFYWLMAQTVISREQIKIFFNIFLASLIAVFVISLAALTGATLKLPESLGYFNIIHSYSFNPVGGSSEPLALLGAVALILAAALFSYQIKDAPRTRRQNIKYYLVLALAALTLLLVNFPFAWITLIIGSGILFGFALYAVYANKAHDNSLEISLTWPLILFMGSIICLFIFSGVGGLDLHKMFWQSGVPKEITLPAKDSQKIIWQSFLASPLFGSGPGTFAYDFALHRPAALNNWQFWQLRFDKAPMHIMELVATVGSLGVLGYLAVVGIFLFVSFIFAKNMLTASGEEQTLAFSFALAALTLFVVQALYLFNTALAFIFWLMLALALLNWRQVFSHIFTKVEIDLKLRKEIAPIITSLVALSIGLFIWFSYWQAKSVLADVAYNNFRLTGERVQLLRAVQLNPQRLNYQLALAKDYMGEIKDEIALLSVPGASGSVTGEKQQKLQTNLQQALKAGEAATQAAPKSVMAWEMLGAIYRDIRQIAVGSIEPAIRYFKQAAELEPTNPVLWTELGKLYLLNSQTKEAADVFEKAIGQKKDYWDASVGLAKTYENLGELDKALVLLEGIIILQPQPEVIYESGRLYYNQGNIDKAIERFSRVLQLQPNYANAIYSLGLAYQKQDNKTKALEQFKKVLELSPGNEAVMKIIEEMENKK